MTAEPIAYEAYELGAPSDGALAADFLSGGEPAFAELYRRYYPRLVRFCTRRTGDRYLAEDVAQETLLRALRYLDGFDTSRPMWPWLKTIAGRIAYQNAQKAAFERCDDIDEVDPDSARAENPCLRIEDALVLNAALERVPARQRAALLMRYVDDWSTADSARFAGMSVPAFEQLLFRARRRLGAEYKRLTETRAVSAFGLPVVALLRRLGSRLRIEHGAATATVGAGAAATLSLSIAVLVAPGVAGGGAEARERELGRADAPVVTVSTTRGSAPTVTDATTDVRVTRPAARKPAARPPHTDPKPNIIPNVPDGDTTPDNTPRTNPPGGSLGGFEKFLPGPIFECGDGVPVCP